MKFAVIIEKIIGIGMKWHFNFNLSKNINDKGFRCKYTYKAHHRCHLH